MVHADNGVLGYALRFGTTVVRSAKYPALYKALPLSYDQRKMRSAPTPFARLELTTESYMISPGEEKLILIFGYSAVNCALIRFISSTSSTLQLVKLSSIALFSFFSQLSNEIINTVAKAKYRKFLL